MKNTPESQRGMTAIGFMMILALCGFILIIAAKLFPVYLEKFKVGAALHGMASDARVEGASDGEVKEMILKKLEIDDVDDIKSSHIKIVAGSTKRTVSINFEKRIHMMGDVDAVVVYSIEPVELGY